MLTIKPTQYNMLILRMDIFRLYVAGNIILLRGIRGYFIAAKTNLISQWIATNLLFHSVKWCNMCRGNLCKR